METPLQKAREEIRADAEIARTRASTRTRTPPRPATGPQKLRQTARDTYTIHELCRAQYTAFIDEAYSAVLRRSPDPAGREAQLRLLVAGHSKIEILGNLRWSPEGRGIGVRVPGLLPRFLVAKATRIPLLGYVLEWLICVAGLPLALRHQRATDAINGARQLELAEAGRETAGRLGKLANDLDRIGSELTELSGTLSRVSDRVDALPADIERVASDAGELRHLVLSMNHWLETLRRNLSALELAEAEQQRAAHAFSADTALRVLDAEGPRRERIDRWAGQLVERLPVAARILDLCSGDEWLARLVALGFAATGVDTNSRIGMRARDAGLMIAVAEPSAVLARTADDSLHALTSLDAGSLLRRMPAGILLNAARRVLRAEGFVFLAFSGGPARIADRLDGQADPAMDGELMGQALLTAGFADIRQFPSGDGSVCLLARCVKQPS